MGETNEATVDERTDDSAFGGQRTNCETAYDTCDIIVNRKSLSSHHDTCDTPLRSDVEDAPSFKVFKKTRAPHTTFYPDPVKNCHLYAEEGSEFVYNMGKKNGYAIIFNMNNFDPCTGLHESSREGSNKDANEIRSVFLELGFIVDLYADASKDEMFEATRKAAKNSKNYTCFACFILSHGEDGIVFARDGRVKIKKVTSVFEESDWNGKPKLFFIQACQGDEYMDGVAIDCVDAPGKQDKIITVPTQSDFLFAYSTVSGFYSWRNTSQGSWFIQTLCNVMKEHSHQMDLMRMLTRVNYYLSERKSNTKEPETNNKRQIASIVSQLRKELYFFPPNGPLKY